MIYKPGKDTSCDYGSCHPTNRNQFTEKGIEDWCIEAGTEIYVNCMIEETLLQAITKDVLREMPKDTEMRALKEDISLHNECCQEFLKAYSGVLNELWTTDGIVLEGNQAVLPVSL